MSLGDDVLGGEADRVNGGQVRTSYTMYVE